MHNRDHAGEVMSKKAAILSEDRTLNHVSGSTGCSEAIIDLIQATGEMGSEQIPRKSAIFEATIDDETMAGFPTNRVIRPSKSDRAHNVINDVNEGRG